MGFVPCPFDVQLRTNSVPYFISTPVDFGAKCGIPNILCPTRRFAGLQLTC